MPDIVQRITVYHRSDGPKLQYVVEWAWFRWWVVEKKFHELGGVIPRVTHLGKWKYTRLYGFWRKERAEGAAALLRSVDET